MSRPTIAGTRRASVARRAPRTSAHVSARPRPPRSVWAIVAAVAVLLTVPLLVGWGTGRTVTSTITVVGATAPPPNVDRGSHVRTGIDTTGPVVAVIDPVCPQANPAVAAGNATDGDQQGGGDAKQDDTAQTQGTVAPQCHPSAIEVFGAESDPAVHFAAAKDRVHPVTTTWRAFGWGPALLSVVVLTALVTGGLRLATGTVAVPRTTGPAVRTVDPPRERLPRRDNPANVRGTVGGGPVGHRQAEDLGSPTRPTPHVTIESEPRRVPEPPPDPEPRQRRSIAVCLDSSSTVEVRRWITAGDIQGTALTEIDSVGGYAEFGELIVWVDNAHPASIVGRPGDSVRIVPAPEPAVRA